MRTRWRTATGFTLLMVVWACTESDETVGSAEAIVPEAVTRIGATEGSDSTLFARIRGLCVNETGGVHLVDGSGMTALVFSASGTLRSRFGGMGGAPFELQSASAVGCLAGNRTVVVDAGARTVKIFDIDGNLLRDWRLPDGRTPSGQRGLRVLDGGRIAVGLPAVFGETGKVVWPRPLYEVRTDEGEVEDTIWGPDWIADRCGNVSESRFRSGFREDVRAAWIGKVRWTVRSDGALVIACSTDRQLFVLEPNGETDTLKLPAFDVPQIPPQAIRSLQDVMTVERGLRPREAAPLFEIGSKQPPIADLLAGAQGQVWVIAAREYVPVPLPERRPPGMPKEIWLRTSRGPVFQYDMNGEYTGRLMLPANLTYRPDEPRSAEPALAGDMFWAVTYDELEVQRVVRYTMDGHE